jgi:hypothetical protein
LPFAHDITLQVLISRPRVESGIPERQVVGEKLN